MDTIRSEVIFTLNDKSQNTTWNITANQEIKKARTIWLDYNTFLEYIDTPTKDRVKFLLENWIDEFYY